MTRSLSSLYFVKLVSRLIPQSSVVSDQISSDVFISDNDLILQFLRERQALETTYAKELIKLVEKFKPLCNHRPNADKILDFTTALTKDHAQVAKFLLSTLNMFERHITGERRSIVDLQANLVNSVGPERVEMLARAEKSKEYYLKKMADNSVVAQRTYETTHEINEATQVYRDNIVELERNRSKIIQGREFAKNVIINLKSASNEQTFDKYESESLLKIQGFYRAFAKSIETLAKNKLKAADTFNQITLGLKEYRFDKVHFENFWQIPPIVYFEHYESGSALKDLIFGVPLSFTFRPQTSILPPFLTLILQEIDTRGLQIEGLYRVSAKNSDRDKARIELETDLYAYNWAGADIHLLAGLVKAYLRELPEPLFPCSRVERDAYSAVSNEATRVTRLGCMMRNLQRDNLAALKFLLEHLNRVNSHHDKNKMGIENISLIFSALLFERPNVAKTPTLEREKDKEKGSNSWFKMGKSAKHPTEREKVEKVLHESDRASYLANGSSNNLGAASAEVADSIKNDLVLSDLLRHIDVVFANTDEKTPTSTRLSSVSLLDAEPTATSTARILTTASLLATASNNSLQLAERETLSPGSENVSDGVDQQDVFNTTSPDVLGNSATPLTSATIAKFPNSSDSLKHL